jgi:hypothetical protein
VELKFKMLCFYRILRITMIVSTIIILTLIVTIFTLRDTFKDHKGIFIFLTLASIIAAFLSIWKDSRDTLQSEIDKMEIKDGLNEIDTLQSTIRSLSFTLEQVLINTNPKTKTEQIELQKLKEGLRSSKVVTGKNTSTINAIIRNYMKSIPETDKIKIPCIPSVEIWNGIDDDCDGDIDEGLKPPCPGKTEVWNGIDDDCDGLIDEGLSAPCVGKIEICNGIDDNCNGWVDEFLDCDKAKKN